MSELVGEKTYSPGSLDLVATRSVQALRNMDRTVKHIVKPRARVGGGNPHPQQTGPGRHVFLRQGHFRRCVVSATLALFLGDRIGDTTSSSFPCCWPLCRVHDGLSTGVPVIFGTVCTGFLTRLRSTAVGFPDSMGTKSSMPSTCNSLARCTSCAAWILAHSQVEAVSGRLRLTSTGESSQAFPPQRTHEDSCNPLASECSPSSALHTNPQKMPLSRPRTAANVDYRVLCCLPQWLVFCVPPRKVRRSPMLFSWFAGKETERVYFSAERHAEVAVPGFNACCLSGASHFRVVTHNAFYQLSFFK